MAELQVRAARAYDSYLGARSDSEQQIMRKKYDESLALVNEAEVHLRQQESQLAM